MTLDSSENLRKLRKKAEEALTKGQLNDRVLSKQEMHETLHELQVYQTELEMQNESLQRTQTMLDESTKKYYDLFNLAPIAYVTLDKDLVIQEANLGFAQMVGSSTNSLIKKKLSSFVAERSQDEFYFHYRRLMADGVEQSSEIVLNDANHTEVSIVSVLGESDDRRTIQSALTDITGIKQTQRELEHGEKRFRALVTASAELIYCMSPDWSVMHQLHSRCFLANTEKPNPNWLQEYVPPDEQVRVMAAINEAIRTKSVFELEYQVWQADGKIGWTQSRAVPLLDSNGDIVEWFGSAIDITERQRAEVALKESEAKFHQIFNSTKDAIFVADLQGRFLEANDAGCQQLGYTREELLRLGPAQITPPEIAAHVPDKVADAMEKGNVIFDTVHVAKDGHQIPVELSIRVIDCQGTPAMLGVVRDITERKQAEASLRESREDLNRAQEVARTGSWRLDVNRNELLWSDENHRIFGISKGPPLTYEIFLGTVHPDDREYVDRMWSAALRGEPYDIEHRIVVDGEIKWVREKAGLEFKDGVLQGGFGTTQDITDRKRREDELERSNAELQQFAYVASHDLQEPLRMVLSHLALLNKKYGDELNPKAREHLRTAFEGAERMRQLVNDLLMYSRIDSKGQEFVPVDMNKVVEVVMNDLHVAINEAKAEVSVGSLPTVLADETQMTQLMTNLISNAIKFRGQAPPKIEITSTEGWHNWTFAVRDNGIGIDPRYHDNLFKMFQRLHTKEEYPGTGIGLAISKKIVERHGGRIWVLSETGKGSTFFFSVPELGPA